MYLKNPYPVTAVPLMVRGQTVVALHSGLGEIQLPHISKHHRGLFIHGNRKLRCLGRDVDPVKCALVSVWWRTADER